MVAQLRGLNEIRATSSWDFVKEIFCWREFKNRKQAGVFTGLTPTQYDSSGNQHE